jgi:hypothetical protein
MQFLVPQFIDVEDKIVGPLTLKQFLYGAGSIGMGYVCYRFIPYAGLFLGIGSIALGWALGFYQPNKRPFAFMVESAFSYYTSTRLYVWKQVNKKKMDAEFSLDNFHPTSHVAEMTLGNTGNKLSDLSWGMDVHEGENTVHNESSADNPVL